jgi:hypothetical protein
MEMITTEKFSLAFLSMKSDIAEKEIDLRSTLIENDILTFSFTYGGERYKKTYYLIDYISFCSNYAALEVINKINKRFRFPHLRNSKKSEIC